MKKSFLAALGCSSVLVAGLLASGCSEESSTVFVPSASTAAPVGSSGTGVTTSGSTTGTTPAGTPISAQQAVDAMNLDLATVWNNVRPLVEAQVQQLASQQLVGQKFTQSSFEIEVRSLNGLNFEIRPAPGFKTITQQRLEIRVPESGTWKVVLDADVRVKMVTSFWRPTIDIPLVVELEDVSLLATADLDDSDPTRITVRRVDPPKIDFKVKLTSNSTITGFALSALNPVVDWLARRLLDSTLQKMLPILGSLQGMPGPVPADGAPPIADSGANTPFAEVVANVDEKIRRDHLPHGTILLTEMDTDQRDSWLDAFKNGGPGSLGTVVQYHSGGDSAIWTGQYLASQAYRYHVTQSPDALGTVWKALRGVGALLDVNGATGLLARGRRAPELDGRGNISRRGVFRSATINGQVWVGRQGGNGISRDQYSGVFFGLILTHDLVNDPLVKQECALRLRQMVDYLVAKDWLIDEDRPSFNGTTGSRGPTFWAGVNYQKLAFLLCGERSNPNRYTAQLNQAGPLAETAWFGMWTDTFGFDHYYKFNLLHVGLYNYFRLETDMVRWQAVNRGFRLITRYVGHHRNAHFDLIRTSVDPSSQQVLFPQTREVMRRFLGRNHRELAPATVDLSNVQWQTMTVSGYNNTPGGGVTLGSQQIQVPSEPLDFHQRRTTGNFHWQRDPFSPATPNAGNSKAEKHGLDVVLPYWMGRHMGAF